QLRQKPGDFPAPPRLEPPRELIVRDAAASQGIDPRRERDDLRALVRSPDQHARATGERTRVKLLDHPALADARLAEQHHDALTAGDAPRQGAVERRELGPASHD